MEQPKEKMQQAWKRLDQAISDYDGDGSQDAIFRICEALIDAYIYNWPAIVPIDLSNQSQHFSLYKIDETHSAYIVCTDSAERPDHVFKTGAVFINWRILIQSAARNATIDGMVINPYRETPHGGKIHIHKESLRFIILHAEARMQTEAPPLTLEQMINEKTIMYDRLELAVNRFDSGYSPEVFSDIVSAFTFAYIYNLNCSVPMINEESQLFFSMYRMDETRYAYMAYTIYENPADCLGGKLISMPWRKIIRHAEGNKNYDGLMINPYHKTPHGAILYLRRDTLRQIIEHAEDTINGLPDDIRAAVKKGI